MVRRIGTHKGAGSEAQTGTQARGSIVLVLRPTMDAIVSSFLCPC